MVQKQIKMPKEVKIITIKKLPSLVFSERFEPKSPIVIRTQEEIDFYKKIISPRKARKKRYSKFGSK